jgi:hypothetical protein
VTPLSGGDRVIVSTTKSNDVWLFNPGEAPRQLTHDGRDYAAAWSPSGQVLVQKQLEDNRIVIFLREPDGRTAQVTNGTFDGPPSFAGATQSWVYVDYSRKTIVRCRGAGNCSDVYKSDSQVQDAVMSPDERRIAFITPFGVPRLHVIASDGTAELDLGPTAIECPTLWTSARSLWAFGGAGNLRRWEEIDVPSARRTGRVKNATTFNADAGDCGWETEDAASPFFQRARIVIHENWQATRARALSGLD